MKIVPIGMKAANEYVAAHHRHHKPVHGCKFCVSVENEKGECCGVAICGRPVSRYLDNATRTLRQPQQSVRHDVERPKRQAALRLK